MLNVKDCGDVTTSRSTDTYDGSPAAKHKLGKRMRILTSESDEAAPELCGNEKKQLCQEYSSASDTSRSRSESESPILVNEIPGNTSYWTDNIFPKLRITVDQTASDPFDVFTRGIPFRAKPGSKLSEVVVDAFYRQREKNIKFDLIKDCYKFAMSDIITLNNDHIDEVDIEEVVDMKSKSFKECFNEWILDKLGQREPLKKDFLTEICYGVFFKLKLFVDQLLYLVHKRQRENKGELTEGMYQELFMTFVRIFGLEIVGCPNLPAYYILNIGDTEVKSLPDALIGHSSHGRTDVEDQVIAVVQVNSYSPEDDCHTERKLPRTDKSCNQIHHVYYKLKGQHIGEMLTMLPSSVFGLNGIYGIIVQGTLVTFVSLVVDEYYYDNVKKGSLPKATTSAEVKYSRGSNILSKRGRRDLVQTFLDMAELLAHLGKNN